MAFVGSSLGLGVGSKWSVASSCSRNQRAIAAKRVMRRKSYGLVRMQTDDAENAEDEAPSDTAIPTEVEDVFEREGTNTKELSEQLLELCAVTDRGQTASADQASQIEDIIASLEAGNPNPTPNETTKLDGKWSLVYISTPFYKANPLLAATATPFFEVAQVRQIISLETFELINEVDIIAFPQITGTVRTTARVTPVGGERLELTVEKAAVKGGTAFERIDLGALNIDIPVEEIYQRVKGTLPEVFIDTYYLDDKLRVSRGKGSKTFVFAKVQ